MRLPEVAALAPFVWIETDDVAPPGDDVLVEAKLIWAGELVGVRQIAPARVVRLQDLRVPVTRREGRRVIARRVGGREGGGSVALVSPGGEDLPRGCKMTLRLGRATLLVSLVANDGPALPRASGDRRFGRGILCAAALHAVFAGLVLAAQGEPPSAVARATPAPYVTKPVALELRDVVSAELSPPTSPAIEVAPEPPPREVARAIAPAPRGDGDRTREAKVFGLVAIVAKDTKVARLTRAGRAFLDFEPPARSRGFDEAISDAPGLGGLVLSGVGESGGGAGGGVPLGPRT